MWKRDFVRYDDHSKMNDMIGRLKKQRKTESNAAGNSKKAAIPQKTSLQ